MTETKEPTMKPSENRYAVPVFDFGWGRTTLCRRWLTKTQDIHQVKCQEWSQGDPEVECKYVDGRTINRYRFRVTDQDRQECSYRVRTQTNYQSRFNMQSIRSGTVYAI